MAKERSNPKHIFNHGPMNMNADDDHLNNTRDALDALDDAHAAAAFRRLVRHLRHRHDAQNIDLMGLAGFCRNCLADWLVDADAPLNKGAARELIHGMPFDEWKTRYQTEARPKQLARMEASLKRNEVA